MTGLSLENDLQKSGAPKISVVVPVYNEEKNIPHFLARVRPILQEIGPYEILFCLDPSTDRSEQVIAAAAADDPCIGLLVFSRRFGQPAATIAGLMNCRGETCVVIDVDLQDPPEVIPHLYAKLMEGNDVVYARRSSRKGETLIKRAVSAVGYWVINAISDVSIPRNTGDFRIVTRRVIEELRHLKESHGFLRGMVALVGFKQSYVEYDRAPRLEGQGKYNRYLGSLKIGLNGVFGFSTYPLSLMMWTGFFIAIASVFLIFYTVIAKLVIGQEYPVGVPTITVLVLFMGGVQLMALGVLGEYIGRIYEEVRHRPQYIIDRAYNVAPIDHRGPNSGADDRQSRYGVAQMK